MTKRIFSCAFDDTEARYVAKHGDIIGQLQPFQRRVGHVDTRIYDGNFYAFAVTSA